MKAYQPLGGVSPDRLAIRSHIVCRQRRSAGFGGDRSLKASPRVELKRAIPAESGIGAKKQDFCQKQRLSDITKLTYALPGPLPAAPIRRLRQRNRETGSCPGLPGIKPIE